MTPTHKALTPAGEWVEGWFDHSLKDAPVIWFHKEGHEAGFYEVIPETVCMATGRSDSNGKMMFNGDFVQVDELVAEMQNHSEIYRIEYDSLGCIFKLMRLNPQPYQSKFIYFNAYDTYTLTGKNINDLNQNP